MTPSTDSLVPEQLWQAIRPLLPTPPPRYDGSPRIDDRAALAGIIYQLRTGVPWRLLPSHQLGCGSPVTCWRRLRDWQRAGVWQRLHHRLLDQLAGNGQLDWSRASLDSLSVRRAGGELTGPNPTDRGKPGSKYHLLVDRGGIPLAVGLSAANTHDSVLLEAMVDAVPASRARAGRPGRPRKRPAKLHLDKGRATTTRAAGGHCIDVGSHPGSPDVASSPANGLAATGIWWSGPWPGWSATGACRSATSGAPTSCLGSSIWPVR
jgi:transposase